MLSQTGSLHVNITISKNQIYLAMYIYTRATGPYFYNLCLPLVSMGIKHMPPNAAKMRMALR